MMVLFSSCHSSRWSRSTLVKDENDPDIDSYVREYADIAMSEMSRTGVPASITLAQAVIESAYGRSRLARQANNHFGIKCHNGWNGGRIYHDDDRRNECFRRYGDVSDSYQDHSDFLRQGSRYSFLFNLNQADYKGWARGLKKAGYATNPRYSRMLIDMIEENNLYIYDDMVLSGKEKHASRIYAGSDYTNKVVDQQEGEIRKDNDIIDDNFIVSRRSRIQVRNRIEYIVVIDNDTFESLAEEFDLLKWEIYRYNELNDDASLCPGQIVYLQPKRGKAEAGNDYHVIKEGDTMYTVSQYYGIKIKALYEKNRMEAGYEPPPGTELWLRKVKPEGL